MNQVQFIGITPEQLSELISKHLAAHIQEIKTAIPQAEQILTREQAAQLLDVDLSTLWHWSKSGKLKSYGIANRVYYKRSEIEAALIPLNTKKGDIK
ncbi:MAG TPA: helix-turn-helix domain-containing protein [Chitinophagales bacterium]|nr:helix-turn-helix domain-containing protein [Chitinophagales bacterium]